MPDSANEAKVRGHHIKLAKVLLEKAEGHLAWARMSRKKSHHAESMREVMASIEFSTELRGFFLGMDYQQELPEPGSLARLVGAVPPQSVAHESANRFTTIAGELFHPTRIALEEWIKQSICPQIFCGRVGGRP